VDFLLLTLELHAQAIWRSLAHLEDSQLQQLAQGLFTTVMSSKAPSTGKKYMYAFGRWKKWAEIMHIEPVFLVQAVHLALYLQHFGFSSLTNRCERSSLCTPLDPPGCRVTILW